MCLAKSLNGTGLITHILFGQVTLQIFVRMVKVKVKVGVKQLARVAGIDASRATEELQAFEALQEAGGLNSKNADAVDKAIVWGLISFWRQDQKRVGLVEVSHALGGVWCRCICLACSSNDIFSFPVVAESNKCKQRLKLLIEQVHGWFNCSQYCCVVHVSAQPSALCCSKEDNTAC